MPDLDFRRRSFLALAASTVLARRLTAATDTKPLDTFIDRYMKAMNAPGMTLAIARRDSPPRIATFGYSDIQSREAVTPDHLFQVGSISKSFVGLTCLALHDEGKLDFDRPILDY